MRRSVLVVVIAAAIASAGIIIIVYGINSSAANYSLDIDPLKDEQSLFSTARVMLSNTGKQPLNNIVINYDGQSTQTLASIPPGQKLLLSPPENVPLGFVTVTTSEGLNVTKAYRTPIKLPGMMGS